jgi:hypothetical protein
MKLHSFVWVGAITIATTHSRGCFAFVSQVSRVDRPSGLQMSTTVERSLSTESAEFPPPLTPIEKFQRAATFWSVAIPIVANYYGLIGNLKLQELLGSPMREEDVEVRACLAFMLIFQFLKWIRSHILQPLCSWSLEIME